MLNGRDKWNARPYPELLAEKDRQLVEQKRRIEELEKELESLSGYEVQHEIEIKEGHLPTLIDLIKQLPELKLPNGDRLLKCYNKSPYYRSEEHTSELQSLMRNSYAVFCLKKTKEQNSQT